MGRQTTAEVIRGLRILKHRLKRRIRVERMILFGSRARGDWLLTSDADVMIVSPDFQGHRFADRSAEVLAHWRGRVDLEVFCYTPEEIASRRREIGIITQALTEGRRI
jgi:predicted nucleotidyltransferase